MSRVLGRAVCSVAAKRLLNKALQMRKEYFTRSINAIQISGSEYFGVGCHTASSEPYYFDTAYQHVKRDSALAIDENGKCIVANEIKADSETTCNKKNEPKKWECSSECKPFTKTEVDAIAAMKDIRSSSRVDNIDEALFAGDFHALMELAKVDDFHTLLNNDVESSYEQCTDSADADSMLRQPHLESQLVITHAGLLSRLEKEIDDFPKLVCCSCERLHQRKSVTRVKLSDNLGSEVWLRLKSFVLQQDPNAGEEVLYICKYCKPLIKKNKLPPRCVLNGLQMEPIPPELADLDSLSRQLIQRAKCYQTVVRLGTYTAKVPIYNSLKACKGTMFFLSLPLNKTLETGEASWRYCIA